MSNDATFIIRAKDMSAPAFAQARSNLKSFTTSASEATAVLSGLGAVTGGLTAAGIGAVRMLADKGRELEQLALKAGVSVEEMQALDYATRQYNITGDQFADMVKDAREKVGDFVATGGGEMKDFFEKVAPKVGITAKALSKLSGPEVLVAVKKALDDANVSAKQQTFYLESLANDASTLAPLLADDAAKLHQLTDKFDGLNATLSETDISNLKAMDQKFTDIGTRLTGSFAYAVVGASEQIDWLTEKLSVSVRYWGAMFDSWADNPRTEDGVARVLANLKEQGDELELITTRYDELRQKKEDGGRLTVHEYNFLARQGETIDANRKKLEQVTSRYQSLQGILQQMRGIELPPPPTAPAAHDEGDDAGDDSGAARELWWERLDIEKKYQQASNQAWSEYYASRAAAQGSDGSVLEAQLQERLDQFIVSYGSEEQQLALSLRRRQDAINEMEEEGAISFEEAQRRRMAAAKDFESGYKDLVKSRIEEEGSALERLQQHLAESTEFQGELFEDMASRLSEGMGQAFEGAIFDSESLGDSVSGIFEGMGRSMVAFFGEWAAQRMMQWVLEKTIGAADGAAYIANVGGRGAAETQLGALNAASATAAIPIVGPFLAPGAALAFEAFGAGMTTAAVGAASSAFAGAFDSGGYIPWGKWGIVAEKDTELANGVPIAGPAHITSREQTARIMNQNTTQGGNTTFNIYDATDAKAVGRQVNRSLRQRNKRRDTALSKANDRGRRNRGLR